MVRLNATVGNAVDAASVASVQSQSSTATTRPASDTSSITTHKDGSIPASQPFPQLRNNASTDADSDAESETLADVVSAAVKPLLQMKKGTDSQIGDDNDEDDPAVARPFLRTASPDSCTPRASASEQPSDEEDEEDNEEAAEEEDEDEDGIQAAGDGNGASIGSDNVLPKDSPRSVPADIQGGASRTNGDRAKRRAAHAARAARTARTARVAATHERINHKMHKFTLYETASRYYIVGEDVTGRRFRVLKIDRTTTTADDAELGVTDDKIMYSQKEMVQLLDTIDDGNRGTGGIKLRCTTWGLLGFIKFTGPYYMVLITKKSTVAVIGGHVLYQVAGTELIPLTPGRGAGVSLSGGIGGAGGSGGSGGTGSGAGGSSGGADGSGAASTSSHADEVRFLSILNHVNLTQSFYFSYSYDITNTLQHNITQERAALAAGCRWSCDGALNTMFVWNSHLLQPARNALASPLDWCRPIIHGYIDQASISIYGRTAYVSIIARRSRHFAGARFLKRGANDLGFVANDVETEQIVSEASTTSFHSPGRRPFANPQYTSYVQHRGSIPLYWTQENTGVTPKPPIELSLVDPFYSAAALHFDNLFARYGAPIYVLDLVKAQESTPRESKLLEEFTRAIRYLNQFLPADKQIIHHAWDMSRANKSRDINVIRVLEEIAETVVSKTGFFRNGEGDGTSDQDANTYVFPQQARVQNGVARTNCIDCLDRTNAAQFVIGKCALGHQLHALGILEEPTVRWETDAVNLFTHMYHDHGDTIAVQYGGSQLVNTMETYRKINQWTSHSRDMLETFKRYYNNSFLDGQRQEAYNLFLGNYVYTPGQPLLWELPTDYHLHREDPRRRQSSIGSGGGSKYINWYTPENLRQRTLPPLPAVRSLSVMIPATAPRKQPLFKRKRNGQPKFRRRVSNRSVTGSSALATTALTATDDYWIEFYRPYFLSSFAKMFAFKMKSTMKYIPIRSTREGQYDLSPFKVRSETHHNHNQSHDSGTAADSSAGRAVSRRKGGANGHRKEVSFVTPQDVADARFSSLRSSEKDAGSIRSGHSVNASDVASDGTASGLRSWLSPSLDHGHGSDSASIRKTAFANQGQQQQPLQEKDGIHNLLVGDSTTGRSMAAATTATTAANIVSSLSGSNGMGSHGTTPNYSEKALHRDGQPRLKQAHEFGHVHGQTHDTGSVASTSLNMIMVSDGGSLRFDPFLRQEPKRSTIEKSRQAQLIFAKMVEDSLDPTVEETEDYERYLSHPQNLQIVVSTEDVPHTSSGTSGITAASKEEYQQYVNGNWKTDGLGMNFAEPEAPLPAGSSSVPSLPSRSSTPGPHSLRHDHSHEDDVTIYSELLRVPENPLTVTEGDAQKKRYKAYRKWLRGKSLFKQQMMDA
ncbi:phosphatidylinositol-3,5-bisphosphate 5-phosphatase [Sporothrix epigloea]|uniref:Phosphatidylinositol-3,5-bisphosphate 5-phosphatase n=1 Tax=Sporothrix epigloea TaxID=1892477 RepID=A0ABP0E3H2_9PEZI